MYDLSKELGRDGGALLSVYKPLGSLQRWGAGETEENGMVTEQDSLQCPGFVHVALSASRGNVTVGPGPRLILSPMFSNASAITDTLA